MSASTSGEASVLIAPGGAEKELAVHVYSSNKLLRHFSVFNYHVCLTIQRNDSVDKARTRR